LATWIFGYSKGAIAKIMSANDTTRKTIVI
jgi:hypothetical protein